MHTRKPTKFSPQMSQDRIGLRESICPIIQDGHLAKRQLQCTGMIQEVRDRVANDMRD